MKEVFEPPAPLDASWRSRRTWLTATVAAGFVVLIGFAFGYACIGGVNRAEDDLFACGSAHDTVADLHSQAESQLLAYPAGERLDSASWRCNTFFDGRNAAIAELDGTNDSIDDVVTWYRKEWSAAGWVAENASSGCCVTDRSASLDWHKPGANGTQYFHLQVSSSPRLLTWKDGDAGDEVGRHYLLGIVATLSGGDGQ